MLKGIKNWGERIFDTGVIGLARGEFWNEKSVISCVDGEISTLEGLFSRHESAEFRS